MSNEESAPNGERNELEVPPKFGVVGEVTASFSSSSTTLCIGPVSTLPPNGLLLAANGLGKSALDMFWCTLPQVGERN